MLTKSARVKIKIDKAYFKRARKEWAEIMRRDFIPEMVDHIQSGESPVLGEGSFKEYTEAYAEKKGMPIVPVDMTVTGRLLRSLRIREIKGGIRIWFADRKASYHDWSGAGKSRVIRRLMPHGMEQFTFNLHQIIKRSIQKALDRAK